MASKRFKRPTKDQCLAAIGVKGLKEEVTSYADLEVLHKDVYRSKTVPEILKRVLYPDPELFNKVPKPGRSDWLACQNESGQTFSQFTHAFRNNPDAKRNTIYILPVSFFENDVPADISSDLAEFASLFFGMTVKVMPTVAKLKKEVPNRINEDTDKKQVDAGKALEVMKKVVPADGFCLGALTLCDLYPRDEWNFVFGLASLQDRVGIYSLARFMPGFPEEEIQTADLSSKERTKLLLSACRLMCHEMCHMFGLKHCIYYHCLMNGSNNYDENQRKPLYLCPVCLRKLQLSCGFDVYVRYQRLLHWCLQKDFDGHAEWLTRRLQIFD